MFLFISKSLDQMQLTSFAYLTAKKYLSYILFISILLVPKTLKRRNDHRYFLNIFFKTYNGNWTVGFEILTLILLQDDSVKLIVRKKMTFARFMSILSSKIDLNLWLKIFQKSSHYRKREFDEKLWFNDFLTELICICAAT